MKDVAMRRIMEDELLERYGEYELKDDGEMVRLPRCGGDVIGVKFVFPARLPMLKDGSVIDPMKFRPLSSENFTAALPGVRLDGAVASVLFGNYDQRRHEFHLVDGSAREALIKIDWDVELAVVAEGRQVVQWGQTYEDEIKEKLGGVLIFTKTVCDDPYKLRGSTYIMRKVNVWMEMLYEVQERTLAMFLGEAAKELEKFEREKEQWRDKMLGLIPEGWEKASTRRLLKLNDGLKLTVEVSPGHWSVGVYARYDAIGYEDLRQFLA